MRSLRLRRHSISGGKVVLLSNRALSERFSQHDWHADHSVGAVAAGRGYPTVVVTPSTHAPDTMHQRASAFMRDYFRHLSSPQVLEDFERDYTPYVSYYDKRVDRATLMRDKARFVHRWPQRSYRLREESLDVSCDTPDLCMVTGLVDFECRSAERHAVSTGGPAFTVAFGFMAGTVKSSLVQSDVIRQP